MYVRGEIHGRRVVSPLPLPQETPGIKGGPSREGWVDYCRAKIGWLFVVRDVVDDAWILGSIEKNLSTRI